MEGKRRKKEKTSPILMITFKVGLGFFLRKDYCPHFSVVVFFYMSIFSVHKHN